VAKAVILSYFNPSAKADGNFVFPLTSVNGLILFYFTLGFNPKYVAKAIKFSHFKPSAKAVGKG
jgi:hypothetical protein